MIAELRPWAQSGFEAAVARWLAELDIPSPECNAGVLTPVGELHPDFFWPHSGVALAAQGRAFHLGPAEWERDLERKAALAAAGIPVLELSWHQFARKSDRARFARYLEAAPACGGRAAPGAGAGS